MYKIKQIPEDFIVREIGELKLDENGKYSYYLLRKRDYSTVKAVEIVAERLGVGRKFVNFAGSKDRNAVTEQFISVQGGPRQDFSADGILLKFLGRGSERLNLGELKGNHFEIIARNLGGAEIRAAGKDLAPIPNFFDAQRFGINKDNHIIGKHIIKKQYKHACMLIAETHEWLNRKPNDYIGALRSLDKSILRMYVHAYQSYLWNKMAEMLVSTRKNIKVPLLGFETEIRGGEIKDIADKILKEEGISPRDFIIREIPELSAEGGERDLFVDVQNLKIGKPENDELNEGRKKMLVSFDLPKGSYATVVVKCMFSVI